MGLSLEHNIDDVIGDIDDVKGDIRGEMRKRVGRAISVVWADAKQYVLNDPHASGELFRSITNEEDIGNEELTFTVTAGGSGSAEYAAVVEYGSGIRREVPGEGAEQFPPFTESSSRPPEYPFGSPDINRYTLAPIIEEWMLTKGVTPKSGSYFLSALGIANTIIRKGTYAHPYLRPAWFENELKVKRAARNAIRNATR